MKLLIIACLLLTTAPILGFLLEQPLSFKEYETCQDVFEKYKENQDYVYAEIDGDSFNIDDRVMPGFSVVCNREKREATAYIFSKTGILDSEQEFFFKFLLNKINQKDKS